MTAVFGLSTNLVGLSYEETKAHLDRVCAEARAFAEGRAERERMAQEARRERHMLRGEARAIRGRMYDMIQTGIYREPR